MIAGVGFDVCNNGNTVNMSESFISVTSTEKVCVTNHEHNDDRRGGLLHISWGGGTVPPYANIMVL
jgi:hypothetical protein